MKAYHDEYTLLYKEQAKDEADQDKTLIKDKIKSVAEKAEALPKNCDPEMIKTFVADKAAFEKLLEEHVPTDQQTNY